MFYTAIILTIIFSLPAFIKSVIRASKERTLFAAFIAIICAFLTATFASALFHANDICGLVETYKEYLACQPGVSLSYIMSAAWLLIGVTFSMITYINVVYVTAESFLKWLFADMMIFLMMNMTAGFIGMFIIGETFDKCFFGSCCGMMGALGLSWGLTYKEICVIINIYLQGFICWYSVLWLTWTAIRAFYSRKSFGAAIIMVVSLVLICIYTYCCKILISIMAGQSMEGTYNQCFIFLKDVAKDYSTTYNMVNYAIFIILFMLVTGGNLILSEIIRRTYVKPKIQKCNERFLEKI